MKNQEQRREPASREPEQEQVSDLPKQAPKDHEGDQVKGGFSWGASQLGTSSQG